MVGIKQNLVASSKHSLKCPNAMTPEYITIHNTSNDASAANEISYMIGNASSTSFHYAVDDKEIVQGIPENRNAWHAGDGTNGTGNRKSISIEICYSKSGGSKFTAAEKNAAEFTAYLLKQRGWTTAKVKKHQDWAVKYCPHRTLDLGWQRFINMVQSYLDGSTGSTSNSGGSTQATSGTLATITADVLNIRSGAGTSYKIVGSVKKNEVYTIVETSGDWGKLKSGAGWIHLGYTTLKSGATASEFPYTVKITADVLNVRKGAGTGYAVATTVKKGEVYTIVAESNGWGQLKSGAGWISLDYAVKT